MLCKYFYPNCSKGFFYKNIEFISFNIFSSTSPTAQVALYWT